MSVRRLLPAVFGCLAIFGAACVHAQENCRLIQAASVDMGTTKEGLIYVPMTISGREEKMLVDTGGLFTTLTSAAVDEIGLRRHTINLVDQNTAAMTFYGGATIRELVNADGIQLGNLTANQMIIFVMPDNRLPSQIGGTLAANVLRRYDVELDFAKGKFNLFSPDHCEGKVVYWTQGPYTKLSMTLDDLGHVKFPVMLDGKQFAASLDTGSARSLLRLELAESVFGWTGKSADLKPIGPAGNDADDTDYHYPFHMLTFGDVEVVNPDIVVVPEKRSKLGVHGPQIILGIGILRQLHLYLAYRERSIYATGAEAH